MKIKFYLIAVCVSLIAMILSCSENNSPKPECVQKQTPQRQQQQSSTSPISYNTYYKNNMYGVIDSNGEFIVPAKYDHIQIINNLIIAKKDKETFFFNKKEKIFSQGTYFYSIEDKYITADREFKTFIYFFDTGLVVEDVYIYYFENDTFLCQHNDESYAFYSTDGKIKGQNLQNISCLQKIKNGHIEKQYLAFDKEDGGRLIYTTTGEFLYDINATIWQNIALNYLNRDKGNDIQYEYTYNYKIDLDKCIQDHQSKEFFHNHP